MATYILTVEGTERPLRLDSLNYQAVINGRDVLNGTIISELGAYRPSLGEDVLLSENGTDIFGGIIDRIEETGVDQQPIADIASDITCVAYNVYADRRFITETFVAGTTIASIAGTIVTNYLSDYGITLDAGQVTGPSLTEDLAFDGVLLSKALDQLTTLTGYFWKVSPGKAFRLFTAGSAAAPFNVVDGDGNNAGDIRVVKSREKYYNRVILKYGDQRVVTVTDAFTGNGVLDTFTLTYRIDGFYPNTVDGAAGYGVVDYPVGPTTEALGGLSTPSGYFWEYDPTGPTIKRRPGPVGNGVAFTVRYDVQFPQTVTAEDASEISMAGLSEIVVAYPDVYDKATAQGMADEILAQSLNITTEVEYQTYEVGLLPGMTQTITAADRAVNDTFLITEVQTRSQQMTQDVLRTVKAIDGASFRGSFRDVYKAWLGNGVTSTVSGPPASAGGCGWDRWNKSTDVAEMEGDSGIVSARGTLGGTVSGVEGLTSMMRLVSNRDDDGIQQLAIGHSQDDPDADLTFWVIHGAGGGHDSTAFIEHDSSEPFSIFKYGSGSNAALQLSGPYVQLDPNRQPGWWGEMRNLWTHDAQCFRVNRRTSTSAYTIDTDFGSGGGIYGPHIYAGSANVTWTLPALAANTVEPVVGWARVLEVLNDSAYVLTLDGNSTETIAGRLTFPLMPGGRIRLLGWNGTGVGWKVLAYDLPPMEVTLDNGQIKALAHPTPVALIPAPPSGFRNRVTAASLVARFTNGAYAGADTTYASLQIQSAGGAWLTMPIFNDNSIPSAQLTTFLNAAQNRAVNLLVPDMYPNGWVLDSDLANDPTYQDASATEIAIDNNGSGDLTAGHASNTLKVTLYYDVEALT